MRGMMDYSMYEENLKPKVFDVFTIQVAIIVHHPWFILIESHHKLNLLCLTYLNSTYSIHTLAL